MSVTFTCDACGVPSRDVGNGFFSVDHADEVMPVPAPKSVGLNILVYEKGQHVCAACVQRIVAAHVRVTRREPCE